MKAFRAILILIALLPHFAGAGAFHGGTAQERCPMEYCASVAAHEQPSCGCMESSDGAPASTPALPAGTQRDAQSHGTLLPPAEHIAVDAFSAAPAVLKASRGMISPHLRPAVRPSVLLCSLLN